MTTKKSPAKPGPPEQRAPGEQRHWLVKTEPAVFSYDDLARSPKPTVWDGVRNYQARNYLRDELKPGDLVLVYHSNAEPPAVVGLARVVREGHPDPTQFDPQDPHFDPKSTREAPRWFAVDLKAVAKLKRPLPLAELRQVPGLARMMLLQKGSRLSVQPVTGPELAILSKLGGLRL